jgi:hypothetical protein
MKRSDGLLVSLALLAAAGCGKSDAEKFADTFCAEVAKCCVQYAMSANGQLCHFLFTGGSYNAAAGDACLAEIKAQSAAGTFCTSDSSSSVCNQVAGSSSNGNRQPGATCEFDSDCATSGQGKVACASAYDGTVWIHKCQVQMAGQAGDSPCLGTQDGMVFSSIGTLNSTDVPASGYVCNTADGVECSSGACVALAGVGQGCSYASDCVRTAYCDATSHCTGRVAAGGACTGVDADECEGGYYCPQSSPRQCTAKLPTGATCASDAMCSSDTCSGSTCQPGFLEQLGWAIMCS